MLSDTQIIHIFAVHIKIGGLFLLAMITVKERLDYKEVMIDEFSLYDLYSKHNDIENNCDVNLLINFVKKTFINNINKRKISRSFTYGFCKN